MGYGRRCQQIDERRAVRRRDVSSGRGGTVSASKHSPTRSRASCGLVCNWPTRLSFYWHSLIVSINTPTKGRGRCSRMTELSPTAIRNTPMHSAHEHTHTLARCASWHHATQQHIHAEPANSLSPQPAPTRRPASMRSGADAAGDWRARGGDAVAGGWRRQPADAKSAVWIRGALCVNSRSI